MSRSAMGVRGGHGQGGLLVWESTETLPEGGAHTTSVTERAGREDTDAGAARLEPEVVLPAQVLDRRATMLQPEKRLMLAVLEDATATLLRPHHARQRRALREAEEWLDSADTESPFAFIRICEVLDLDAQWLRTGLVRARK